MSTLGYKTFEHIADLQCAAYRSGCPEDQHRVPRRKIGRGGPGV